MTRTITLSLDQFFRPQPGGIATYVRGLVQGLDALDQENLRLVGVTPSGRPTTDVADLRLKLTKAPASIAVLTRLWSRWPLGVPTSSDVVHATSVAGPFGGGRKDAVHSAALHDLLWRDEPGVSTTRGVRFHERRLQLLRRREDVRILTTAPGLSRRLAEEGFDPARLHYARLGVDDVTAPESEEKVRSALGVRGVRGPFTLYVGTREPRKNLERLVRAHRVASLSDSALGRLVLVGPEGWGGVETADALTMGLVSTSLLKGLYRDASVVAYVPLAEGWGLPPVEALSQGARVVVSAATPSVADNVEVVHVDPLDVDDVAQGLLRALSLGVEELDLARRRASVAALTWHNTALDHVAAWR